MEHLPQIKRMANGREAANIYRHSMRKRRLKENPHLPRIPI